MDHNSKIYARKVLLVHLAFLLIVLSLVFSGARGIYAQARQQAIRQAGVRQALLAVQTAHSVESYYQSVIDDLNLLCRSDATNSAANSPTGVPLWKQHNAVEALVWYQMSDRVAAMFLYDRQAADADHAITVLQPENWQMTAVQTARLRDDIATAAIVLEPWLKQVDQPSVSRLLDVAPDSALQRLGAGGVNLVCVPTGGGGQRLLVAVVPAAAVESQFLPTATQRHITSATLMDDTLAVVASTTPALVGTNLKEIEDPALRKLNADFLATPSEMTEPIEMPVRIASTGVELAPRLVTIEPVNIGPVQWGLAISSPLSAVDVIVQDVFRIITFWGIFLVVSMTAILVSTAMQLIRIRLRMERVRSEMLNRELSRARQIQMNWLPDRVEAGAAVDLAAVNHPANHISGDFYNWFNLPDGRWVIIVGDVSGHGMAAAFLMATTQLLVRTTMPRLSDPGQCMEEVNRQLCTQVFHGQFVTMQILVLNLEEGTLAAASAGQAAPLIRESNGSFVELPLKTGVVLAVDEDQKYPTENFKLAPHSTIVMYTDGVVEVKSERGKWFDLAGLQECLQNVKGTGEEIIEQVVNAVNDFRGDQPLEDDMTLVAVQAQLSREAETAETSAAPPQAQIPPQLQTQPQPDLTAAKV